MLFVFDLSGREISLILRDLRKREREREEGRERERERERENC